MRYVALACDYDETLAHESRVSPRTVDALSRLRESGRRLVLVTGRELADLQEVFDGLDLFDRVVAENGAVLHRPGTGDTIDLGEPPPAHFVEALRRAGVAPLAVGRVIVATREPHETTVIEAIRRCGLELQVIFNKGAVMVLPPGVNKATGLAAALAELGVSAHSVAGVGDAENDHAFLSRCECAVAVGEALPALKERVDWVTRGANGDGVVELVEGLLANDLADLAPRLARHRIPIGTLADGTPVTLEPYGETVLLAGASAGGKTTLATAILERFVERGYQCCIVDPEGDYGAVSGAVVLGDPQHEPVIEEVLDLLSGPDRHVVVNLLGIALEHRPAFFHRILPRLQALRARVGHPAWVLVDEAHHLLPTPWDPAGLAIPMRLGGMLLVTVHPERVSPHVLGHVSTAIAVGNDPVATLGAAASVVDRPVPADLPHEAEAVIWRWASEPPEPPAAFRPAPPHGERRRHRRKYAEGELPPERSFFFRGPHGVLHLRAQNLTVFLQLADGVDDATWEHHRRRGDYSRWFREKIKDPDLAEEAEQVERQPHSAPSESRAAIRAAVTRRYTLPA